MSFLLFCISNLTLSLLLEGVFSLDLLEFLVCLNSGFNNLQPTFLNNSTIPNPLRAEVSWKIAPISSAYFCPSTSLTSSSLNKSHLLATNTTTILKKI